MTGRKNGTREDARLLNSYLDAMQLKIYDIQKQMIELNAEKLRNRINGVSDKSKDILEIFQDHNDKLAKMVGSDYALGTLGRYRTSYDHTKAFIQWKYKTSGFDIHKLDYEFISEYEFWLKTERHLGHNTAMKYLTNFKKIVFICVKKGWLIRDPFVTFKMTLKEVNREALTSAELLNISNKDLPSH
nr:phage integrase SAM-like domain-containing protein [Dyadobacter sp. UC 10]